ncbi:right-handed parallel beta-helix repeat-containing protein, partial [Candidatus Woesearchaeota archaeon]|nr:right-handed parallel beta-helix repeat-containing protein [Candidatus Woesearchaeota archaeon]
MYLGKRGLLLVMIVLLLVGGISLFSFQNRLTGLAVFTENMDVPEETSAPEEVTPAFVPISPSVTIQTDLANTTQCGYVNNSITLTSDVTANATCFNINVSHVILNCNRFNINYSITGVPGSAINISNENNITVQNCNIYEKNATNDQKPAIRLVNVTNSSLQSNVITTLGNASYGLYVINSTLNNFYDNRIITVNESAYGIYLVNDSQNNTFTDNNISARAAFEILDETGDDYVNLFVYNNSFGEIK